MKTLTVNIQDSFLQEFLNYAQQHSSSITLMKDKNLELDPYFYERQKELHQIRADMKNDKNKLISFEDFETKTSDFEKELEIKYAN